MATSNTVETGKVAFTGPEVKNAEGEVTVPGTVHEIDLGTVPSGKDKGKARKRLSGATVLAALYTYAAAGASSDEVLSMLLGT